MSPFKKIFKYVIHFLNGVVDFITLVLVVSVILLASYSLWDANQVYQAAESTVYEAYIPDEGDTRSFDELRAINPEVMGWLRVNDTHINYPLLQAEDNSKYVNADAEGNYSLSGAIFLHCANAPNFTDFNSVIYGHHMEKNKMFGDIGLFSERDFFDSHPYGNLFFQGKDHGVEFFAFLLVDAYDDVFLISADEIDAQKAYLDGIYQKAMYVRPSLVTTQDRLVLLSTCTTEITNGRHILVGRLTDEVYPEAEKQVNTGAGVDRLNVLVEKAPLWVWSVLIVLQILILLLLILILILLLCQRKKTGRQKLCRIIPGK